MSTKRAFDLNLARSPIERALDAAGYDRIDDPGGPSLVQARRDEPGGAVSVVVDGVGRMRFTRVRQIGPEEPVDKRLGPRRVARGVRRTDETLTVILQLRPADAGTLAELLAELEAI
jgi:hypothetical protein